MKFAFYGRVSTEEQQDPESSRAWQLTRARALADTHCKITIAYFDIGQSRPIPWKHRPQAALLLAALRDPSRGFDAATFTAAGGLNRSVHHPHRAGIHGVLARCGRPNDALTVGDRPE